MISESMVEPMKGQATLSNVVVNRRVQLLGVPLVRLGLRIHSKLFAQELANDWGLADGKVSIEQHRGCKVMEGSLREEN